MEVRGLEGGSISKYGWTLPLQIGKGCLRFRNPNEIDFDMVTEMLDKTVSDTGPVC
jgi:hypothetical protein